MLVPKICLYGLLAATLASCTSTVPLSRDNMNLPKKTRGGKQFVPDKRDMRQVHWWKAMHDPALNQLIQQALANNNQVKSAKANILQARAKLQEARFAWIPTFDLAGNGFVGGGWDTHFTPQGALAKSRVLSNVGNIRFKGYYGGFVPNYSLNILQNISKTKLAKASLSQQIAEYHATRLSVISQTAGTYFMLLGQRAQLQEQKAYVNDLHTVYKLEWLRYLSGAADLSYVTNLEQQIKNNQANVTALENSITQLENALQVLLNRNPGAIKTQGSLAKLPDASVIPSNIPSAVLKHRPDVIVAKQNVKIAEANVGVAYSSFFPAINLTGNLGGAGVDLARLLKLNTALWIAQAAASIPVLSGVAYEQIVEAKEGMCAVYYSYLQTLRSVFADVDNSLTDERNLNQIYHDKEKALQATETSYKLVKSRYEAGSIDLRGLLNAKLTVDNAQLDATTAKMQWLDSLVQAYQALAGGYA